jgi:hypothetical protein
MADGRGVGDRLLGVDRFMAEARSITNLDRQPVATRSSRPVGAPRICCARQVHSRER